jgi:1,4-dihydroxy-2-naphthoyl-CoA hydrolase
MLDAEHFNRIGQGKLPGTLGILITHVSEAEVLGELAIVEALMAPNGYLHAGSVISLADTCAGYGCVRNLPSGASGFTTIELKSNHPGTTRDGTIECRATPLHLGRTTHVWDAVVRHRESGRTIALFRCTQMILYATGSGAR